LDDLGTVKLCLKESMSRRVGFVRAAVRMVVARKPEE
jgi:hypothetical protein